MFKDYSITGEIDTDESTPRHTKKITVFQRGNKKPLASQAKNIKPLITEKLSGWPQTSLE